MMDSGHHGATKLFRECQMHWRASTCATSGAYWGESYVQWRLNQVYANLVPAEMSVLVFSQEDYGVLDVLQPACGIGMQSEQCTMVRKVGNRLEKHALDVDALGRQTERRFDYIVIAEPLDTMHDIQLILQDAARCAQVRSRIIVHWRSSFLQRLCAVSMFWRLSPRSYERVRLNAAAVDSLERLARLECVREYREMLFPWPVPGFAAFCNRFLVHLWPFSHFARIRVRVLRLQPMPAERERSVSVVIPARNEAGNIPLVFQRVPRMGSETELVFVEGNSSDETHCVIQEEITRHPEWSCQLLHQQGRGKADAVRLGFAHARGEIVMILDADLTVPPEDLSRFYEALSGGIGECINGVRLIYPQEKYAMRFINSLGNKFFALALSFLLGQRMNDTLCGTKALWRSDCNRLMGQDDYFSGRDPFGDFTLLVGAGHANLRILDMPIHYRQRMYGQTNIHRWTHGWVLLKLLATVLRRVLIR